MENQNAKQQKTLAAKLRAMDKRVLDKAAPTLYGFLCGFESCYESSASKKRRNNNQKTA